nr:MAG: NS1 [Ecsensius stictus parvovirus]
MSAICYLIKWGMRLPDNTMRLTFGIPCMRYFISSEVNNHGQYHTHVIIQPTDSSPRGLSVCTRTLKSNAFALNPLYECTALRRHGGSIRRVDIDQFIRNYFAWKIFHATLPHFNGRKTFFERDGDPASLLVANTEQPVPPVPTAPSRAEPSLTGRAATMARTVALMVKKAVVTLSDFRSTLPNQYWDAVSKGQPYVNSLLREARAGLVAEYTLQHFLIDPDLVPEPGTQSPPDNIITQVIAYQGYDPAYFCAILSLWSNLDLGKRGTLAFWGVPSSGKSLIHSALRLVCPISGSVDKASDTFPFNMCSDVLMISWEEGVMKCSMVETAKELMGSEACDVACKGQDSKTVCPTPVIVTSNADPTLVHSANAVLTCHRTALELRMVIYHFTIPFSFGSDEFPGNYPTNAELRSAIISCASWGVAHPHLVPQPLETHVPLDVSDHDLPDYVYSAPSTSRN